MKKLLLLLSLLAAPVFAQSGSVTISASNIVDSSGSPLSNGTISFTPVNNDGTPISYWFDGKGQAITSPTTAKITNGAFSTTLADTSLTLPVNVCFAVSIVNNADGANVLKYTCVQPAYNTTTPNDWCVNGTCNFDTYQPNLASLVVEQVGPTGPTGATGPAGTAATISIGTVTTLSAGSDPTVTNSGSSTVAVFNFGIPAASVGSLDPIAANSVLGNNTASSATPSAISIPSCSGTGQALTYTSASGFGCATLSVTLSGDVTGSLSATMVGAINGVSLSGLATGLLKNTTSTGTPSIAIAGIDYPGLATVNVFTADGAASTPSLKLTGAPYAAGTATTNYPGLYYDCNGSTQPTSLSGVGTYFGINTCTGFTGNLIDAHINGGASVFSVSYAGGIVAGTASNSGVSTGGGMQITNNNQGFRTAGSTGGYFALNVSGGATSYISSSANGIFDFGANSCTTTCAGILQFALWTPGTIYSAAGTALPTCASTNKGSLAVVSDATSPTYMTAYTGGGGITANVICSYDGTSYTWKTH